jgi:hypothetical protein
MGKKLINFFFEKVDKSQKKFGKYFLQGKKPVFLGLKI